MDMENDEMWRKGRRRAIAAYRSRAESVSRWQGRTEELSAAVARLRIASNYQTLLREKENPRERERVAERDDVRMRTLEHCTPFIEELGR